MPWGRDSGEVGRRRFGLAIRVRSLDTGASGVQVSCTSSIRFLKQFLSRGFAGRRGVGWNKDRFTDNRRLHRLCPHTKIPSDIRQGSPRAESRGPAWPSLSPSQLALRLESAYLRRSTRSRGR